MDWNTRIEITPIGKYVSRLNRADQRLDALTYPGLACKDTRVRKQATEAAQAAFDLRCVLHTELHRFDGEPNYQHEPDDQH